MPSSLTAEQRLAAQRELLDMLSFNLDDGRIWLSGKRMMLLDVASFGALRDELICRLGTQTARAVLTRIGYASGVGDADLIRKRWPTDFALHAPIGAQIHQLEGVARIEARRVDWNPARKHFEAEYLWHHSIEDDAEIISHGLGSEPTCWMEIGYATGYVSRISDRLTIFREIECRSMGTAACRVIAKPADAWGDIAEDLEYLGIAPKQHPVVRKRAPDTRAEPVSRSGGAAAAHAVKSLVRPIVGRSAALSAALSLLARVAPTRATVLVTGESGVGKELFARALHEFSPRRTGPFVAVNCAAIPETLIEAELFGVERGAFTGANASRPGRFERADGGTLFLDEIATLSPVAQTKLLRALQEGEVERVGGAKVLKPDVRVVAAANINLHKAVQEGQFRDDLYFRLNVFPIELPPLRERRDDIPILVDHFLAIYSKTHGRAAKHLTPRALQLLLQHRYPGNIRELERIIERAVILAEGETIDVAHIQVPREPALDPALLFVSNDGSLRREPNLAGANGDSAIHALAAALVSQCETGEAPRIDAVADELLTSVTRIAADRCGGNLAAAARLIGLKRHQLEYRLKRAGP